MFKGSRALCLTPRPIWRQPFYTAPSDIPTVDHPNCCLKNLSLRESEFPVNSAIEAKAASALFKIELPFADSMSQFEAGERHGRGDERFEALQWATPRLDPTMVLLNDFV